MAPPAPPNVAIISNEPTPYRLHVLRRIARELPEVRTHNVFTHTLNERIHVVSSVSFRRARKRSISSSGKKNGNAWLQACPHPRTAVPGRFSTHYPLLRLYHFGV